MARVLQLFSVESDAAEGETAEASPIVEFSAALPQKRRERILKQVHALLCCTSLYVHGVG